MTRPSSLAAVAGAFGAALLVAFFKGSVLGVLVGALLSPLPLAMAVLGLGPLYLPVAVMGGAVTVIALTGSFVLACVYLVVDAAPVAMLTRILRMPAAHDEGGHANGGEDAAIGRAVSWMMLAGVGLIIVGLLSIPSGADGIEAALRTRLDAVVANATATVPASGLDLASARAELVRSLSSLLPGAAAWNWSLRVLISAAVAQFMLKRMGLALRVTPDYRRFQVPSWFFLLLAGTAGLAVILKGDPGFIAGNAAIALCLPPVLQGLAVVHCAAARLAHPRFVLAVFYTVALALPTAFIMFLVVAGVGEHFFQLRGRYLSAPTGGQ